MSRASLSNTLKHFDELPDAAWVDIYVVAALLDIGVPTAWRHAARGEIPRSRKFGGLTRFNVGELRRMQSTERDAPVPCGKQ
ncbi:MULTISPECIES: helix-turn-helix transcriptional regulator [Burkholderia cepacia complex]|uniref:helix-turn-helix transcriptional regulator n=1 Tax=Burkholderia cepacia complex TaxID=87882 RepID=UPI0009C14531|nr:MULTISPECIES: helix-turn-helix domain-containing protein [Burkholderia cepacia complex]